MLGCMKPLSRLTLRRFALLGARGLGAAGLTLAAALPAGALGLTAGYYGETVTHPGLLVGVEQGLGPLAGGEVLTAGHLGFYAHPGYADVRFARTELALRWKLPGAFDLEAAAGIGLMQSRAAGDLYVASSTGAPERTFDLGRPAWMPALALGVGRTWEGLGRSFGRLEVFGQYPYNGYLLPHAALSLGWTWRMP